MARPRKHNRGLPARVYTRSGAYYYVDAEGKWHWLARTERDMYRALADLLDESRAPGMAQVFDRYATEVLARKAEKTQKDQRRQLENLQRAFGKMEPGALLPEHVAAYHDKRGQKAPKAANRELALLRHVCKYAIRWGWLRDNPCAAIERHPESPSDRYVEDWEFAAALAYAEQTAPPYLPIAMWLAYLTGQRQADILSIKLSDLDDYGIHFYPGKTRHSSGKRVHVEWSDDLRRAVAQAREMPSSISSVWLIHDRWGQRIKSSTIQTALQRLMRRCIADGVLEQRFTFPDLRAKARSDGQDPRLLGHANPQAMERIYKRTPDKVKPVR